MARWEPDARGRLAEAAMELYGERGFENTTVAEIAERAGLTERTFFRHYADKREVLFAGSHELAELLVGTVEKAPEPLGPLDAVAAGLEAAAGFFPPREYSRRRQAIVAANPDLQERELIKFASMSAALAATLRRRGVADPGASLAAEVAMAVFRTGFERWLKDSTDRPLQDHFGEALDELKALTAAGIHKQLG
jgi:AcrR family transcriptional regulator